MNFYINILKFKYFNYFLEIKNLLILNLNKQIFIFFFNYFYNIFFYFKNLNNFFFKKIFILFTLKANFYFFYKYLNLFLYTFYNLYYTELFLDGIYYRIKYYKELNILGFILGYNHYILISLPRFLFVKIHIKKRKFFCYSFFKNLLHSFVVKIVNLKFPNLFKGKGIKIVNYNYRLKKIKKKK